jgi:hypothetical protein
MANDTMRKCCKCHNKYPLSEFYYNKSRGYTHACRECLRKYHLKKEKEYRKKHKKVYVLVTCIECGSFVIPTNCGRLSLLCNDCRCKDVIVAVTCIGCSKLVLTKHSNKKYCNECLNKKYCNEYLKKKINVGIKCQFCNNIVTNFRTTRAMKMCSECENNLVECKLKLKEVGCAKNIKD